MNKEDFDNYKFYYGTEIQLFGIDREWIKVRYVNFIERTVNDIKIENIRDIRTIFKQN